MAVDKTVDHMKGEDFFFCVSPHEIKEEIETKHFERTLRFWGSNPALQSHSSPNRSRCCAFHPQPCLPWVLSCDEC